MQGNNQKMKLRELIRAVRACKTQADERAVVSRESALIRSSFKEEDNACRHRNIAKLLFLQLMGYPTHFGQIECLKLAASPKFIEKRIGYLGLTQFLNETNDVIILATGSMQNDLQNTANQHVVALALQALGDIGTPEMCRELSGTIKQLLNSSNSYLRKKAALTMVRIVQKCPDLIEDLIEKVDNLLNDKHHGVMLTGISLLIHILYIQPSYVPHFRPTVPALVRVLKNLLLSGFTPEHDIAGITDPFLQIKILRLLKILGTKDQKSSDEMNDILAQVATNTESAKNTGNAVLYECVRTIIDIESTSGLKVLAINIMGKFLTHRENNMKYVALNTLQKIVNIDANAVQRHKQTIMDCLKDSDISIRKQAVELVYVLINEQNLKQIIKEMLNYLLVADNDFKSALTTKICSAVIQYSPNRRWHFDTILKVLTLAGNYASYEIIASTALLVQDTEQLQQYSTHKTFYSARENMGQIGLILLSLWLIGEFGQTLVEGNAVGPDGQIVYLDQNEVLDFIEKVMDYETQTTYSYTPMVKEFGLICLVKLSSKFESQKSRILNSINMETNNKAVEIQQRACEFLQLLDQKYDEIRKPLLTSIPTTGIDIVQKSVGEAEQGELIGYTQSNQEKQNQVSKEKQVTSLIEIDHIIPQQNQQQQGNIQKSLIDIFGEDSNTQNTQSQQVKQQSIPQSGNLLSFEEEQQFGGFQEAKVTKIVAYENEELKIEFNITKPSENLLQINAIFTSKISQTLEELSLKAAGTKAMKLEMQPPSSKVLSQGNKVQQSLKVQNNDLSKKIMMKLRISYTVDGFNRVYENTVSNFP